MEGKYYTASARPQSDIVAYVMGSSSSNMPATTSQTANACKYATYNNYTFTIENPVISYSSVKSWIDNDKPITALLNGYSQGSSGSFGHYVMVYGYLQYNGSDGIKFYDPYPSVATSYCYNFISFRSGGYHGGAWNYAIHKS